MRRRARLCEVIAALLVAFAMATPVWSQILSSTTSTLLQLNIQLMKLLPQPEFDPLESPPGKFNAVKPQEFDPGRTFLVQAAWLHGTGCPTNAIIANPNADFTGIASFSPYTDPACLTGDPDDSRNEGLLLAKTGPTGNFASATAELINVKGIVLTELGYDIRKPLAPTDPRGSHCGAGAPRFNIITSEGLFFLGCNSPPGVFDPTTSAAWIRLRWGGAVPLVAFGPTGSPGPVVGTVERIVIVFDEGQDTGPDNFGAAILDNIAVNGTLVGRGATDAS
jgi:hypothetical protein